ncbi:MAG: hypothetical protein BGN88_10855 [Clostridiales bacterium 43-6]|nr:MAG: hypothetical protein BGN88_10855 [Clostridiales bacterium 43-6]
MNDRQKQLKEEYKQTKLPMGIVMIKNINENKCSLVATGNVKGTINKIGFELELGGHKNKELQKAYNDNGKDSFVIEVLDILEYEENKDDYKDELLLLKEIWAEKLRTEQGAEFY